MPHDIAEILPFLNGRTGAELEDFSPMANTACKMVTDSTDAYVKKDVALARQVCEYDDVADGCFDPHPKKPDQYDCRRRGGQITASMSEGLVLLDADGMVLRMNTAAKRIFSVEETAQSTDFLAIDRSIEMNHAVKNALNGKKGGFRGERNGGEYQFLTNGILSGGRIIGAVISVDVPEVANEAVEALKASADTMGVAISVDGTSCAVKGVRQYIYEIIYNLCDNAIRYNVPGGTVAVTVRQENGGAEITVADTGIGIAPEHHARIFERFYRVDKSHSKETGGTGLGLSIVKHAVQYHGGRIELESAPGKGTAIRVKL